MVTSTRLANTPTQLACDFTRSLHGLYEDWNWIDKISHKILIQLRFIYTWNNASLFQKAGTLSIRRHMRRVSILRAVKLRLYSAYSITLKISWALIDELRRIWERTWVLISESPLPISWSHFSYTYLWASQQRFSLDRCDKRSTLKERKIILDRRGNDHLDTTAFLPSVRPAIEEGDVSR